jgi:hypothetical protein
MVHGPDYWKYEGGGQLIPAVERYLSGQEISTRDVALLRAYLRQWIAPPVWTDSDELTELRDMVNSLTSREDIVVWTSLAIDIGIDPW